MFAEMVGASRALQAVLARVAKVAPSDATVLVMGETGTGEGSWPGRSIGGRRAARGRS